MESAIQVVIFMDPEYEFSKIPEITAGCTYGRYWNYRIRSHGRSVFKDAVQAYWADLKQDPWKKNGPWEKE